MVDRLRRSGTMTFRALCGDSPDPLTTVARFLSLLELFREGAVVLRPGDPAGRAHRALDRRRGRRGRHPDEFDGAPPGDDDAPMPSAAADEAEEDQ